MATGCYHSLAVRGDGALFAFGDNDDGKCAIPPALQDKAVGLTTTASYNPSFHNVVLPVAQQGQVDLALLCLLTVSDRDLIPEDTALHALGYLEVRVPV